MKFKREQLNPFTKKWDETGTVNISEADAAVLNRSTKHTNVRYTAVKTKAAK